jgi:hypothetical protein
VVFLPADPPRGARWADHRTVINGIFFRTLAGCPWPSQACNSNRSVRCVGVDQRADGQPVGGFPG